MTSSPPGPRLGAHSWRTAMAAAVFVAAASAGYLLPGLGPSSPAERSFAITARSFAFEPSVIRVRRGDHVTLRLASADVVHGFSLDEYGIDATVYPLRRSIELREGGERRTAAEVSFVASRAGKFRYRCSVTCGSMHPFMTGELIVEPNRLWPTAAAAAIGMLLGGLLLASSHPDEALRAS